MKQDKEGTEKQKYIGVFLFLLVVCLGIFFRTYNFSDWLRFNADQARDAAIARNILETGEIPLLGPVAGGTNFRIGPISIYFQSLGAWVFGISPDKMAYADLLFGILSVPLLFLLLKEYFESKIALAGSALYATSFFAIQYSRFAWNSNSAQFFVMLLLYALIKIADAEKTRKIIWAIISGLALGVLAQLHTLLLFATPFFMVIMGVHLIKNKRINILHLAIVLAIAAIVNFPQILHEVKTDQGNITAFYDGMMKKSPKQDTLTGNILHVSSCQLKANASILVPREENESCNFPFSASNLKKLDKKNDTAVSWLMYAGSFVFVLAFSFFGYFQLTRRAFKEKDEKSRIFFAVIFAYLISLILISFPFGSEISLRYFIMASFVPYLFAALFLEWATAKEKFAKFAWLLIGAIIFYNIYFNVAVFKRYADSSGNMIDGSMQQAQQMAEYFIESVPAGSTVQIGGKYTEVGRFVDRISYFFHESEVSVVEIDDQENMDKSQPFFVVVSEMSKACKSGETYKDYGTVKECKKISDVTILKMN